MTNVTLVLASAGIIVLVYLAVVATLCVCLDRPSDRVAFLLRIVFSWVVPVVGPLITIRISAEEFQLPLRRRWWLWPVRSILGDPPSSSVPPEASDIIASAEHVLPGITSTHLPP